MARKITYKYWFIQDGVSSGTVYEDEKGNWIVVFDGKIHIGKLIYVHDANGYEVSAEEIGLLELLRNFIVEKIE